MLKTYRLARLLVLLLAGTGAVWAQTPVTAATGPEPLRQGRLLGVVAGTAVLYALSTYLLGKTWYTRRVPFHTFNDNNEWLQMDKVGHATTAYAISRGEYELMRWSGVRDSPAALTGGAIALLFQSTIEVFDGHSEGWGFSKGDMAANAAGIALFIGQQVALGQQPLSLRYGFSRSIYPPYRPELLGRRRFSQYLKDYNGQQYWLSVQLASMVPTGPSFPRWLTLDLGYSGSGMTGGRANPPLMGADGQPLVFQRVRQFYLAPGVDLSRLVSDGSIGHLLLGATQFIKPPGPSLEYNSRNGWRWHPLRPAAD